MVVDEAITWLDTPYSHQGRKKRVGVDCVGIIIGVANELGLSDFQYNHGYQPLPDGTVLKDYMDRYLLPIPKEEMKAGDMMLCWFGKKDVPQHTAFVMPNNKMLHAYSNAKKVVTHRLTSFWEERFLQAYKYHGLGD